MDLSQLRQEYRQAGVRRRELHADPVQQFRRWFEQAKAAELLVPNSLLLVTVACADSESTRVNVVNLERQPGTVPLTLR